MDRKEFWKCTSFMPWIVFFLKKIGAGMTDKIPHFWLFSYQFFRTRQIQSVKQKKNMHIWSHNIVFSTLGIESKNAQYDFTAVHQMLYRYNNNNVLCSSNLLLEAIFYNLWATYSCRDTSRQQSYFQSYTSMHVRRYYIYYLAISVSCVPLYYVKSYSKLMHMYMKREKDKLVKQATVWWYT